MSENQGLHYIGYLQFEELARVITQRPTYLAGSVHTSGTPMSGVDKLLVTVAQVQGNALHYTVLPIDAYATIMGEPSKRPDLNEQTKYPWYMRRVQAVVKLFEEWLFEHTALTPLDLYHALPFIPEPKVEGYTRIIRYDAQAGVFVLAGEGADDAAA